MAGKLDVKGINAAMAGDMGLGHGDNSRPARAFSRRKSATPTSNDDRNESILLRLPVELLQLIHTYLPLPSRLSLRHVCRDLYNALPTLQPPTHAPATTMSLTCEQKALRRNNEEAELLRRGQKQCITCGTPEDLQYFRWPDVAICAEHDGFFTATAMPAGLEPALQDRLRNFQRANPGVECWVAIPRTYCVHDKDVLGWHVQSCTCRGGCQVCGLARVTCFARVPACKNMNREFVFGRPGRVEAIDEEGSRGWRRLEVIGVERT